MVLYISGAVIIFTALLSVAFLGRIVCCHMWLGMGFIMSGLVLVGVSDVVFGDHSSDNDMNAIIAGMFFYTVYNSVATRQGDMGSFIEKQ